MIWLAGNIADAPDIILPHVWKGTDRIESPDTGEIKLALPLVHLYVALRDKLGVPIRINSGFRTAVHQQWLRENGYKTSAGLSPHETGTALDLQTNSPSDMGAMRSMLDWLPRAIGLPDPRIGYETYGKTFLHVDFVFMLYGDWPGAEYPATVNPRPDEWREGARW